MSEANAADAPQGAMAPAEADEEAAVRNLAQAMDRWQQAASTASKMRRVDQRESASMMKNHVEQVVNKRVQEIEEKIVEMMKAECEKINRRLEETMTKRMESLEQKLLKQGTNISIKSEDQTPPARPVGQQQGASVQRRSVENTGTPIGVKRIGSSIPDSEIQSVTPSKTQRIPQGSTGTIPDPATPTFDTFSPPSSSIPPSLDRRQTALLSAVKSARMNDVLNYLDPKYPVDTNFLNEEGDTLLHVAAKSTRSKILKVLLVRGRMQVDALNSAGQTALHVAASAARGGTCVQILLKHKADVNKRDFHGDTALHIAARNGHELIVQKLLQSGAFPSTSNNDEEMPIDVATTDGIRYLFRAQNLILPPAGTCDSVDPSHFVSTSMTSANETNYDDIYID